MEIVRRGYEHFEAAGDFSAEVMDPEFVWDMSNFRGWPEGKLYPGVDGARQFMRDWLEAWDDWEIALESLHNGDDKVVGIVRQQGRSKSTGLPIDITFAQVFTLRDGKQIRMEMYADASDGLAAAGISA